MAIADLEDWIREFSRSGSVWFAKRLSANDTLATNAHQAGPYIPKEFLFRVFPSLNRPADKNPTLKFNLYIDSHMDFRVVRAVWYNNKVRGEGTRNESRLTNFGGGSSALLDPDSTGAIAVFVFVSGPTFGSTECHVWVSQNGPQEDLIEDRLGPIEPKSFVVWAPGEARISDFFDKPDKMRDSCQMNEQEIPPAWIANFPSGEEIIQKTLALRPPLNSDPDARLIKRRLCEYEIFLSIEKAFYLPQIRKGFDSIDAFISLAQSILQSRKSRSGTSLELHVREIMKEEGLDTGVDFTHRPVIEGGKRPDFLFPSKDAYENINFPANRLRMLAAKTTCRDRWRQVINEADRIRVKHLLTLQEGVSEGQFKEMREAGVHLVVPTGLHKAYPLSIRPHLISFESFIGDVRLLAVQTRA